MFAALAKFRVIDRNIHVRRALARPTDLVQANDNRPAAQLLAASRCLRRPALVGHWHRNVSTGRLEWHWTVEGVEQTSPEELQPSTAGDRAQTALDGGARGGHHAPLCPRRAVGI
jgi:hypothetical protein